MASDQFIGEIRIFPFQAIPTGWLACEGQVLSLSDKKYVPLFGVIGPRFGNAPAGSFALPDFRGIVPTGAGIKPPPPTPRTPRFVGETGGTATVTLERQQLPIHWHTLAALGVGGNASGPRGNTFARTIGANMYATGEANVSMSLVAVGPQGNAAAEHENMQPFMALNFCIAYEGVFPG